MSRRQNDFIDNRADVGSEDEEEEEVDEETGEPIEKSPKAKTDKKKKSGPEYDDSSEEEDDDDEEAMKAVREGFIVDEDEDEDEEDNSGRRHKRRKRKRPHRTEEEDEDLDEEDLDLVMENQGMPRSKETHLRRLKRGRIEEDHQTRRSALDISSDEEADALDDDTGAGHRPYAADNMDDFIEDSESEGGGHSDNEAPRPGGQRKEHRRVSNFVNEHLGLTEDKIGLMEAVFGNGDDYDYALVTEQVEDMVIDEGGQLELKDVFEPTDLEERMLTEKDNVIRQTDIPERFQLAREPYANLPPFDDKTLEEEGRWIANKMLQWRPKLDSQHHDPFRNAVKTVVVFFNKDNYEVPFIYQHRRDFLNYTEKRKAPEGSNREWDTTTTQLLNRDDLWEIFEWDLKFRSFYEKRDALRKTYEKLGTYDATFERFNERLENPETINDLHDYLHFRYNAEIKDAEVQEEAPADEEGTKRQRRPRKARSQYDQVRSGPLYNIVKAFGISADQFAENVEARQTYIVAEDPDCTPEVMAGRHNEDSAVQWEQALWLAKNMFIEELFISPRLRKCMAEEFFRHGLIHVKPTEKGVKKIDEQHIYYEFKYLRNQPIPVFFKSPALFLRMLKAEEEGLVEVKVEHENKHRFIRELYEYIMSENQSEIAEQWNRERKEVIDKVMVKFEKSMQKYVKESIKNETEDRVALACRRAFYDKLNQAPYHTSILVKGDVPRVLALSPGNGIPGKDAIVGVFMDENGRVAETLKLANFKDEQSREDLLKVLRNRKPDVIGIAGFSVATHRMKEDLQAFIQAEEIMVSENDKTVPLEVIYVDDEIARIFRMSPKGKSEFPHYVPMQRYCIALCRYVQDPLTEYACQGKDILSLSFDPAQHLIPQDKLMRQLESALVDIVNMVGVSINEALKDNRLEKLLPYIAGLGPRKAQNIVQIIQVSDTGRLNTRMELVGEGDVKYAVMDFCVFTNCASFLWIEHDKQDDTSEVLDGTRIHPEDYELGRKMAADAMEYDEEDVTQLVNTGGPSAVIAELLNGHEDKLNELILEDYADELESNFGQRKRATLETIRNELMQPYQELRSDFKRISTYEVFTMLTGETKDSLQPGMVVPVNIRKLSERFIAVRLDCGVDGNVASDMMSDNSNFHVYSAFETGQTVQGCIMNIDYEKFYAELSLKGRDTRKLFKQRADHDPEEWDDQQEEKDKAKLSVANQEKQRTTRVIKHPLFKPFNSRQAEEYLKGMSRGDAVIRPSSNGMDHIAVTWKVSDGIYQHIDVLELDKENEFTVGKTLRVGGKYSYSDLDELIVEHVKAMARKMDEMTSHTKFRNDKNQKDTEQFLVSYTQAAPKKSIYTFTFDHKHPGYFILSFKAGRNAPINCWPVKVVPGGFQLKEQAYPDMTSLCNGFKLLYTSSLQNSSRPNNGPPRGPPNGPPGAGHYSHPQRMQPPPGAYGMGHPGGYGMPIRR